MKKKSILPEILLLITVLLFAAFLIFVGFRTFGHIAETQQEVAAVSDMIRDKQQDIHSDTETIAKALEEKQALAEWEQKKAENTRGSTVQERDPEAAAAVTVKPSVFGQSGQNTASNGHIVGIDPGHQSYSVDMSEQEPLGPGSSEMKARASAGTQGTYTGLPEYQLNLDVSLKLRDELVQRGYEVVMTRTDNDTAISNKERAQYAASQDSEIYVRIHANGDDTHTASGALTMAPSATNPFVSHLSEASVKLSRCILDSYCAATGFADLGVQYYDNMTGINWSTVPVTILEMGFMTHEYDDNKMADSAFQDTMVQGIANGIDAYFAQ